jgi:hypothetical protein
MFWVFMREVLGGVLAHPPLAERGVRGRVSLAQDSVVQGPGLHIGTRCI